MTEITFPLIILEAGNELPWDCWIAEDAKNLLNEVTALTQVQPLNQADTIPSLQTWHRRRGRDVVVFTVDSARRAMAGTGRHLSEPVRNALEIALGKCSNSR